MADVLDRLTMGLGERYTIEREIGSGGMAVVYLARDRKHERHVAIKVLRPEVAATIGAERFLQEIEIAAGLNHPNILTLHDSGEIDGLLYYVMPYVEGESLRARLERETQLSVTDARRITCEIADALRHAHGHGVIHRDIKPANILLVEGHAVVADFGIARAVKASGGKRLTEKGWAIGTPEYMSPEQAGGEADVDARSDIYSLACVFFEMLSGDPPFTGRTPQAVIARQMQERTPSLEIVRPGLPPGTAEIVDRALAKVPADRFQTIDEFLDALGHCEEMHDRKAARRRWRVLAVPAVVALAAAGIFAVVSGNQPVYDPNRIIAFPINVTSGGAFAAGAGEDLAYWMVGALDGWGGFRWLPGWDPAAEAPLTDADMRRITRDMGAAYFTRGRLLVHRDSARLSLDLFDQALEEPIESAHPVGLVEDFLNLGPEAVGGLILALLPEGQTVELPSVAARSPEAVQSFVQGERAYQVGRFTEAWKHYEAAVEHDSLFGLAALKAAKAATWRDELVVARNLVRRAVDQPATLAPRDLHLALALDAYLDGAADSAIGHFREAIWMDPERVDAWMGLGQTYRHLVPMAPNQDSLSLAAFEEVRRLNPAFTPVLNYLIAHYARLGWVDDARVLLEEQRGAEPEPDDLRRSELLIRCAADGPGVVDWDAEARANVDVVFQVARSFHVHAGNPACAEAGWRAAVRNDTTSDARFGFSASVALQSLLAGAGRDDELVAFLESDAVLPPVRWLYVLDALAGRDVRAQAEEVAQSFRDRLWSVGSMQLWLLAVWDTHTGQLDEARVLGDTAVARLARDRATRSDSLLARAIGGHMALATGDTAEAVSIFESLRPNAQRPALTWQPWLTLGYEWLVLARIYEAQGRYQDALRIAQIADAPGSAGNLIFRATNRELRQRVVEESGF